jgi:TIR domain-containing protein
MLVEAVRPSGSSAGQSASARDVIFISKATPGDDEFASWLGPKLEEAGYTIFADLLTLEPGDRWRRSVTDTLQGRAVKMLLCCRDSTLAKEGVQEEIGIALDLVKALQDPKFIIPLRLEPYRKLFGIGEIQYIDFVRGWAEGLSKLLAALKRQKVPHNELAVRINPNWEIFRRRGAIMLKNEPERLTSNWLRVASAPDSIRYFEPTGPLNRVALADKCQASEYPAIPIHFGFLTFGTTAEINSAFASIGRFEAKHEVDLMVFIADGLPECRLRGQDASNAVVSMFRQAWDSYCRQRGFREYGYSKALGFHASDAQARIGERIPWGRQGDRRSSVLRNVARGQVWQFGVSCQPAFWPFPHFKLKSRVLFSPLQADEAGKPFDDSKKQHRLRRSICKGWRNKQWHGRLLAFVELLSGETSFISLPLGETASVRLEAAPILFSSPVSTDLPNRMGYEDEEEDNSTLGRPEPEEEE